MSSITPPDDFIEWATDGAADKAAPVAPELGFVTGDTTDFNSDLNYVNNLTTRWSKFNAQVNAAEIAIRNCDYTENSPLFYTGQAQAQHIRYDVLADVWYCMNTSGTSGATSRAWDSPDGETWSARTDIVIGDTNDESVCPIYSDGTYCATAVTEHSGPTAYMYISTDNDVANMVKAPTPINSNIAYVRDFLYDQHTSRFFVLGINSGQTTGYIYSTADQGTTWDHEVTSTNNLKNFATNQGGVACAIADDSGQILYTTVAAGGMTGTWFAGGVGSAARRVHYLPSVDLYLIGGSSGHAQLLHRDAMAATPYVLDYDFDMVAFSDETVILEGDTGGLLPSDNWATINQSGNTSKDVNIEFLPNMRDRVSRDWDSDGTFEGGQGKIVITRGFSDKLTVLRYGPKNG